jgi:Rrf2 family transcriptional regulator, nitric oxide-sensitive transcriptional repressor
MQLLVLTDFALRVLIQAAVRPGEPVGAAAIADAYGISVDHVAKAAKALTRHGLLRATRGAGGGVQLAKPPRQIRIGDVVRLFEADRRPVACLRPGETRCKIEPGCHLRRMLERAEHAFYRELDAQTLADVVDDPPRLVELLGRSARTGGRGPGDLSTR